MAKWDFDGHEGQLEHIRDKTYHGIVRAGPLPNREMQNRPVKMYYTKAIRKKTPINNQGMFAEPGRHVEERGKARRSKPVQPYARPVDQAVSNAFCNLPMSFDPNLSPSMRESTLYSSSSTERLPGKPSKLLSGMPACWKKLQCNH
jgi:hypothetical protein